MKNNMLLTNINKILIILFLMMILALNSCSNSGSNTLDSSGENIESNSGENTDGDSDENSDSSTDEDNENDTEDSANTVTPLNFTPSAGLYWSAQSVEISTETPDVNICYTTDGTTPQCGSSNGCSVGSLYSSAVNITSSRTIKATGCRSEFTSSNVASSTFTILLQNAPFYIKSFSGDRKILLTWEAVPTATSYNIYWSDSSDLTTSTGTKITEITGESYSHEGLTNGSDYYYIITAQRDATESAASNKIWASPSSTVYSIGGTVSGVTGELEIQNYGSDSLLITSDGNFTMPTSLKDGSKYNILVKSAPENKTCTIENGTGIISSANVSNISIHCFNSIQYSPETAGPHWHTSYGGDRYSIAVNGAQSQFIAVGNGVLSSSDGITWTSRNSNSTKTLYNIIWGDNRYLSVGESGAIITSTDGINWTSLNSGTTENLKGAVWNGSIYVIVGRSGTILTSTNGDLWTSRISNTTNELLAITWNGSIFVAAGASGTVLTSPDGITWTPRTTGTGQQINGITWNGSKFIFVASYGKIYSSMDGINWTSETSNTTENLVGISWTGNKFIAVGGYSGGSILTSSDGVTWAQQSSGVQAELKGIVSTPTLSIIVGRGNAILTSADGSSWLIRGSAPTSQHYGYFNTLYGIAWNGGLYVAVGSSGTILTSLDQKNWLMSYYDSDINFTSVIWANNQFVVAGKKSSGFPVILNSYDGKKWITTKSINNTINVAGLSWSGFRCIVVGIGSFGTVYGSNDCVNWPTTYFDGKYYNAVVWGEDRFVAVGNSGLITTSLDGNTWTTMNSGTTERLRDVIYSGTKYVAVGENGTIVTSSDAVNWTLQTSGSSNSLITIGYGNGIYLAAGNYGTVLTSTDAESWQQVNTGLSATINDIIWSDGKFIAVGDGIFVSP